jgi:hypothetical protein
MARRCLLVLEPDRFGCFFAICVLYFLWRHIYRAMSIAPCLSRHVYKEELPMIHLLDQPHRFIALAMCSFFLACGPILVMPGGALSGTAESAPSDWAWTDEVSTIQLETRTEDPYSVNIWVVASGNRLYVHAGTNRAAWVENMEGDPAVRVQIEEKIFELTASRVVAQQEFDAFSDGYEKKYSTRPRHDNVQEVYLFRLVAR